MRGRAVCFMGVACGMGKGDCIGRAVRRQAGGTEGFQTACTVRVGALRPSEKRVGRVFMPDMFQFPVPACQA